jgi:hypothetical protein
MNIPLEGEFPRTVNALRNCVLKPENQVMVKVKLDKFCNILKLRCERLRRKKLGTEFHLALDQVD